VPGVPCIPVPGVHASARSALYTSARSACQCPECPVCQCPECPGCQCLKCPVCQCPECPVCQCPECPVYQCRGGRERSAGRGATPCGGILVQNESAQGGLPLPCCACAAVLVLCWQCTTRAACRRVGSCSIRSRVDGAVFTFEVGKGKVIRGWDIAVKTMKVRRGVSWPAGALHVDPARQLRGSAAWLLPLPAPAFGPTGGPNGTLPRPVLTTLCAAPCALCPVPGRGSGRSDVQC